MATKTAVTTAPGWWADPLLRHELRYFDGAAWTNHVLDKGVPDFDPLPVGIKLAMPDPERQPFEAPGFAGVPAEVLRKRRRRRARLRVGMWMGVGLIAVMAILVSWFEYFSERFGGEDAPISPAVPTVPTVPTVSVPPTTLPITVAPSATAPPTTAPAATAPPGTAIVVVTAAP